jgi:hypothetical protein
MRKPKLKEKKPERSGLRTPLQGKKRCPLMSLGCGIRYFQCPKIADENCDVPKDFSLAKDYEVDRGSCEHGRVCSIRWLARMNRDAKEGEWKVCSGEKIFCEQMIETAKIPDEDFPWPERYL